MSVKNSLPPQGELRWRATADEITLIAPELAKYHAAKRTDTSKAGLALMSKIASTTNKLAPERTSVSSAAEAIKTGGGNCAASVKIVTGLLHACGMKPDLLYDGAHLSVAQESPNGLWTVDGYWGYANNANKTLPHANRLMRALGATTRPAKYPRDYIASYMNIEDANKNQFHLLNGDGNPHHVSFDEAIDLGSENGTIMSGTTLYIPHDSAGIFLRDLGVARHGIEVPDFGF